MEQFFRGGVCDFQHFLFSMHAEQKKNKNAVGSEFVQTDEGFGLSIQAVKCYDMSFLFWMGYLFWVTRLISPGAAEENRTKAFQ